jgi:dienelactone hydrolase
MRALLHLIVVAGTLARPALSLAAPELAREPGQHNHGPADVAPKAPPPAEVRKAFLKVLDRPKVPANPKLLDRQVGADGVTVERWQIASEKKRNGTIELVPMLIVRPPGPADVKRPTVLVLHGTGCSKESQREWLDRLAGKGFLAVAIDARYHGERVGVKNGAEKYVAAATAAWRATPAEQEHPFFYDTVWDLWRTVDYLVTRPDVDPARLGMLGFSMGGIQTWLAAAVDERVRVAVPAIAVQSFRWSLDNDQWQGRARTIMATHEAAAKDLGEPAVNQKVARAVWSKLLPGILDRFDGPSMIRLLAPRPLLTTSGELDPNCPIGGAKIAFQAARAAYSKAGATDKLKILVAPGVAHKVTDEQKVEIADWLVRWLTPTKTAAVKIN